MLALDAVKAWLADSPLPQGVLESMKGVYRVIRGKTYTTAESANREEMLENLYHSDFFLMLPKIALSREPWSPIWLPVHACSLVGTLLI